MKMNMIALKTNNDDCAFITHNINMMLFENEYNTMLVENEYNIMLVENEYNMMLVEINMMIASWNKYDDARAFTNNMNMALDENNMT